MKQSDYKKRITNMSNLMLNREHAEMHRQPDGNTNKHMMVVAEMKRRNIMHYLKNDSLDASLLKTEENLKKSSKRNNG